MTPPKLHRRVPRLATLVALAAIATGLNASPVPVRFRPVATVRIQLLSPAGAMEPVDLRVAPDAGGTAQLLIPVAADGEWTVAVQGTDGADVQARTRDLSVSFLIEPPGAESRRIDLRWAATNEATRVVEIGRSGGRPITLGLSAQLNEEPFVPGAPEPTRPVRFHVQIEQWVEGRPIALESNTLNSFLGQPIRYGFELGQPPDGDALELTLSPQWIADGVLMTDVRVEGRLLGANGPQLIARSQKMISSKQQPTRIAAQPAEPPDGYVFVVTPVF